VPEVFDMLRGLWRLTWLEIKIFVREPLGVFGTVGVPILLFVLASRFAGPRMRPGAPALRRAVAEDLPIAVSIFLAISAVLSLVAIIAIYRESGILKRLRATPLRPHTILTAHVLAKLLFTAITVAGMVVAGRRYYPADAEVPLVSFALAVLFTTACILSVGFLIASVVPTARFAQPAGALVLYPMLGLSGLFVPLDVLPPLLQGIARLLPLTAAVSLLRGVWRGHGWLAHGPDVAVLAATFVVGVVVSSWVFRWE
jgi:ABC-2 type transport system permease protein